MLRLTPDSPDAIPRLPEGNTEITREPADVLDIAEPLSIPDKAITVLRVKGDQVRLGVQAPKDVAVLRDDSSEKAKSELAAMPAETGNSSGDNDGPAA